MDVGVAELVRGAQQGDVLAMSQLLDALAPYVGRICGAIALEAGQDAAQETLISVFRRLRSLRDPDSRRMRADQEKSAGYFANTCISILLLLFVARCCSAK